MGFCTGSEHLEFMRQCPELERILVRSSGIHLFKYWFSVSQEQQALRFDSCKTDPLKQWKILPSTSPRWTSGTRMRPRMSLG